MGPHKRGVKWRPNLKRLKHTVLYNHKCREGHRSYTRARKISVSAQIGRIGADWPDAPAGHQLCRRPRAADADEFQRLCGNFGKKCKKLRLSSITSIK